jgi:hypothetical protein
MIDAREIEAITQAFAAFRSAAEDTGRMFVAVGHELYRQVEGVYASEHARLSGSRKTARLRKKRQTRVWRWYLAQIEGVRREKEGHADG